MPHTTHEELRDRFYQQFPAFQRRAYTDDTMIVIADWWLSKIESIEKEAYQRGKADGMTEEAVGCEKHCKEAEAKTIQDMWNSAPDYIEENYPKGIAKDRGEASVKIARFLMSYASSRGVELKD